MIGLIFFPLIAGKTWRSPSEAKDALRCCARTEMVRVTDKHRDAVLMRRGAEKMICAKNHRLMANEIKRVGQRHKDSVKLIDERGPSAYTMKA